MNKSIKKATGVILAAVMGISLCSANITRNTEVKAENHTVFAEIEETNITKDELEDIAEIALEDGAKAAELVNSYDETADYDAAVNYALTSYYETENFDQLDQFEDTVDDRSEDIVEGYEAAAEERSKGDANGYEAGTVIAIFDGKATEEEINAVCKAEYGEVKSIYKDFTGDYVATISISLGQTVDMASDAYSEYSITDAVASNDYCEVEESAFGATNDPDLTKQYYLNNIHVKEAWDYVSSHTHDKVLVGVIDTGAQINHPDLKNVISPYSADVTGSTPVLLKDCDAPAKDNHGTGVASIIAAEANNNTQMAGVASCYNNDVVEILAVQTSTYYASTNDYRFTIENQIKAMNYCAEQGVKVVNMSLGGYTYNSAREAEINKITDVGIIVVCAAGNDSVTTSHYPSDSEKAISVAATTSTDKLAGFSNYGSQKDICAPGSSIYMLNKNSGAYYGSGTSMASPVVAAVAAMMCSVNSNLNYFDVKRIMANTATELADEASRNKVPFGVVNAEKCIEYAVNYTPDTMFKHETETYQNLAYKKDAAISDIYSPESFPLENLVDGDTNSKVITESSSGQWVEVDLGQSYEIDKINLYYERNNTTGYSIKISEDHENWTEVASGEKGVQYSNSFEFTKQTARYVKAEFIDNATYVLLTELEVYGYVEPKTEYIDILEEKEKPSEVLNMTANWIFPNAVRVAWKEDANRVSKDYTYNIYVDGKVQSSGLTETDKIITGLLTGTHTFKVTACLNGHESAGTTVSTYVSDTVPTTAPVPTTTEEPTTTVAGQEPLEVIGMMASCPSDNTIEVVWGQDEDRINSGCKYNVYVNDVKVLNEVICNRYTISDVEAGTVQVKVTATLNGIETVGVTETVNVTEATEGPTATEEPTTAAVGQEPLEVIGLIATCEKDNTIEVVWGQDEDRINSGCKYNVYINGEKILSEVICAHYTVENVSAGTVNVRVTAVLNGIESPGVSQDIDISGVK